MSRKFVLIALLLFFALQMIFIRWVPDDAYISLQYARHFAAGKGLVFNLGERVEGFSNLLWTFSLGLAGRAGLDIVSTAVAGSIAASLAALLLIFTLLARAAVPELPAGPAALRRMHIIFGFIAACFFPLIFYATSGMESTAYLLCLLGGITLQSRGMANRRTAIILSAGAPFLLAALMRPEGILFLAGWALYSLLTTRPLPRHLPLGILLPVLLYLTVGVIKYRYYGGVLPNTYYAKPGVTLHYTTPILDGAFYLFRFGLKSGLLLLLPFTLIPPSKRDRLRLWLFLWFMIALQVFFIVSVGVDVLRFDRFILPAYPCYLALALMGITGLIARGTPPTKHFIARYAYLCAVLIIAANSVQITLATRKRCIHDWMHGGSLETMGRVMTAAFPDAESLVANEVGAVSYYSNFRVIDMLGLTNSTISGIRYRSYQAVGTGSSEESIAQVSDYIFSQSPDIIMLPSFRPFNDPPGHPATDRMHPLWAGVYHHPAFQRDFSRAFSVAVHENKFLHVYARRGLRYLPPRREEWPGGDCGQLMPENDTGTPTL